MKLNDSPSILQHQLATEALIQRSDETALFARPNLPSGYLDNVSSFWHIFGNQNDKAKLVIVGSASSLPDTFRQPADVGIFSDNKSRLSRTRSHDFKVKHTYSNQN